LQLAALLGYVAKSNIQVACLGFYACLDSVFEACFLSEEFEVLFGESREVLLVERVQGGVVVDSHGSYHGVCSAAWCSFPLGF
jgi:hypothetical protein